MDGPAAGSGWELVPLDDPGAWADALRGVPHTIGHTWGYTEALQRTSGLPTGLVRLTGPGGVAVCPVAERDAGGGVADVVTPFGFSGFAGDAGGEWLPRAWDAFAGARGYVCGYLALNPLLDDGRAWPPRGISERHELYVLDLSEGMERLAAGLSTNRRRQLLDPARSGAGLVGDAEEIGAFVVEHAADFHERRGAGRAYAFTDETMRRLTSLPDVLLVGARSGGRMEAASMFGHTPHGADFLFNVSVPGGEHHSARLIWAAVERLEAAGVPALNLGGGVRPGDSLAEFKRRFGARTTPLRALAQVYRPDCYRRLCDEAGVDPADRGGYFPAYRRDAATAAPTRPAVA